MRCAYINKIRLACARAAKGRVLGRLDFSQHIQKQRPRHALWQARTSNETSKSCGITLLDVP